MNDAMHPDKIFGTLNGEYERCVEAIQVLRGEGMHDAIGPYREIIDYIDKSILSPELTLLNVQAMRRKIN